MLANADLGETTSPWWEELVKWVIKSEGSVETECSEFKEDLTRCGDQNQTKKTE